MLVGQPTDDPENCTPCSLPALVPGDVARLATARARVAMAPHGVDEVARLAPAPSAVVLALVMPNVVLVTLLLLASIPHPSPTADDVDAGALNPNPAQFDVKVAAVTDRAPSAMLGGGVRKTFGTDRLRVPVDATMERVPPAAAARTIAAAQCEDDRDRRTPVAAE